MLAQRACGGLWSPDSSVNSRRGLNSTNSPAKYAPVVPSVKVTIRPSSPSRSTLTIPIAMPRVYPMANLRAGAYCSLNTNTRKPLVAERLRGRTKGRGSGGLTARCQSPVPTRRDHSSALGWCARCLSKGHRLVPASGLEKIDGNRKPLPLEERQGKSSVHVTQWSVSLGES